MYEGLIVVSSIEIRVSFHERLKQQIEDFNTQNNDKQLNQKLILKLLLQNGNKILNFKNNSEFIIVVPEHKIGISCSIYTTGYILEIEVVELTRGREVLNSKQPVRLRRKLYKGRGTA